MTQAHFTLGPKARAEERRCRGYAMEVQMAQRCSRGRSCPRHSKTQKERMARHQRQPPERSQNKGQVQCRSSSRERLPVLQLSTLHLTGPCPLAFTTTSNHFGYGLTRQVSALKSETYTWTYKGREKLVQKEEEAVRQGGGRLSRWPLNPKVKKNNKNIKLFGRGPRTRTNQAVLRRKSSQIRQVHPHATIMNTMTNNCPVTKTQPFSPLSTNFIVWAFNVQIHCQFGIVTN